MGTKNTVKSVRFQQPIHPHTSIYPTSSYHFDRNTHHKNSSINQTTFNSKLNQPRIWKPKKIQLLPPRDWNINRNIDKYRINWLKHHAWNVKMIRHQVYRKKSLKKLQHVTENVQAELE